MVKRTRLCAAAIACLMATGTAGTLSQSTAASPPPAPSRPESGWKAGVARVRVTPDEPIFMKGYGSRTRPSEGVRQDLFVKALALQDETGVISVLVTSDLHSYTRRMSDTIAGAVDTRHGLPRERLILNGSHTHSGPAVNAESWFRPSEDINEEQQAVIRRYTARVLDQIVDLIGRAIADLSPATVSFTQGSAAIGVNRRRLAAGMRHLPGPVDQDVPLLLVRTPEGANRAVVFGYACHATAAPADYRIGGDWPGYAQAAIEAAHPGVTAMFFNGCGADCDPAPRSTVESPKLHGDVMGEAVAQALRRRMTPLNGPLTAAFDHVDIPFEQPPSREDLQERLKTATGMHARHARLMLGLLDREGRIYDRYPYPVQVWRFGQGLTLIALGGEVVVDYSLRLKSEYGWETTWVAGYSNEVMGYIPSRRVRLEGGYEGGGAMVNYGRPGPLDPRVEDVIVNKVRELVSRTGGSPGPAGASDARE